MNRSELPVIDWWPNPAGSAVLVGAALGRLGALSTGAPVRAVRAELSALLGAELPDAVADRIILAAEWWGWTGRSRVAIERRAGWVRTSATWELLAAGPRRAAENHIRAEWAAR